MLNTDFTEAVYQFIWNYVTEQKALPAEEQIAEALQMSKEEIAWCIHVLRYEGRLEGSYPAAHGVLWMVDGAPAGALELPGDEAVMTLRTMDVRQDADRLYAYLVAFVGDNGYAPRRCDIADDLGFPLHRLDRALRYLRCSGRIRPQSLLPTVYTEPLPPAA